jgi:catechol 2,3-dioxygenase-like lactoylglutathione lyase family enzyme
MLIDADEVISTSQRSLRQPHMRLNHVTLIVTDFKRSTAFYKALGLIPTVHEPPRYARFRCPDSDETLSVEVTGEQSTASRTQLYFECPDLDATVAQLKAKGFVFEQDPTDMFYLWREARLKDPDGHDIRLYFAADNRLNPPWKVNSES